LHCVSICCVEKTPGGVYAQSMQLKSQA